MKTQLLIISTGLFLVGAAKAQANPNNIQSANQLGGTQKTTAQLEGADEADQLSASVIKLYGEGKYDEALPLAKRALKIREKMLGADHELVATALINIAELYLAKKESREAEPLLTRAVAILEKALGADDPGVAVALERLAQAHYGKSQFDKAEAAFRRALSIKEKAYGEGHAQVAQTLELFSEFLHLRGKYEEAATLYKRLLEFKEKTLGDKHSEVGEALERYACLLRKGKRNDEAKVYEDLAYKILFKDYQPGSLVRGGILNGKAIRLPSARYPPEALKERFSAMVTIRVLVDETGKVVSACALSPRPEFIRVTEQAASQALFNPTVVSGKPVKVEGVLVYNFVGQR